MQTYQLLAKDPMLQGNSSTSPYNGLSSLVGGGYEGQNHNTVIENSANGHFQRFEYLKTI